MCSFSARSRRSPAGQSHDVEAASRRLSDLVGTNAYIKSTLVCQAQGTYSLNALGVNASCSQGGLHILP